jgi:hypothetical protein
MRRDARRAWLAGFNAGKRAAKREADREFALLKADIRQTREHIRRIEMIDNVDPAMALEHGRMTVH